MGQFAAVVAALVEGNSIRATMRMTGVAKNTVVKLLVELGTACDAYQRQALVNLRCRRIQCDEIWSFVYAKAKNASPEMKMEGAAGDVWTWTAIDADSKLMISWLVGGRDGGYAYEFMQDVAGRLAHRVQLTTDGHKPYLEAVEGAFGCDMDYAQPVLAPVWDWSIRAAGNWSTAAAWRRRFGLVQASRRPIEWKG